VAGACAYLSFIRRVFTTIGYNAFEIFGCVDFSVYVSLDFSEDSHDSSECFNNFDTCGFVVKR